MPRPLTAGPRAAATLWSVARRPSPASEDAFEQAMAGQRQVLFVSGEAGIGKTSVVDAFLSGLERSGRAAVSRGQCVEQATVPEPYLAILDALSRLLKHRHRAEIAAALKRCAPTWVAQLPGLAAEAGEGLEQDTLGATPGRMLREIAEALEDLTRNLALVLFVDDLHWADEATLDFVGLMARRPEPARFLLVVAYRPSDLAPGSAALKTRARAAGERPGPGGSARLSLGRRRGRLRGCPLRPARVARRLHGVRTSAHRRQPALRHPSARSPRSPRRHRPARRTLDAHPPARRGGRRRARVAPSVHRRHPRTAARRSAARLSKPPASADRISRPRPSRRRWSATGRASRPGWTGWLATGSSFASPDPIACPMAPGRPVTRSRTRCFKRSCTSACPRSAACACTRASPTGAKLVYGPAVDRIATELALHFERGAEPRKAITYLRIASTNAVGRFANREAARCLAHALSLTSELDEPDRWQTALVLLDELGHVRRSMGDMPGASEAFLSAAAAADSHGRPGQRVESLILAASALSWFDRVRLSGGGRPRRGGGPAARRQVPAARARLRRVLSPSLG